MTPRTVLANTGRRAWIPAGVAGARAASSIAAGLLVIATLVGARSHAAEPPEPSATAAVASEPDEPLPPPAAVTPTVARSPAKLPGPPIAPPPLALALRWSPLVAREPTANLRKDLAPIVSMASKGKAGEACTQASALLESRLIEASKLFYAPVRKDANTDAIDRFLERWVRGNDPVLVIAAESLSPAPSWRDAAAAACFRAGRFADAERLLRPAAFLPDAGRLRAAVVLLRWMRTHDLRSHAWLLEEAGAGLEARLLRLVLEPADARPAALAALRQGADARQRELVDAVEAWLRSAR